jgi:hypothetical protein
MNVQDSTNLLIQFLRNPDYGMMASYGYDIYVPNLLRHYLQAQGMQHPELEQRVRQDMPAFYDAAWELCRRGILRPGISQYDGQATNDGHAGNGYSFTSFGKRWLKENALDDYVPTEPGRFAEMLQAFKDKFGPGFYERSQEAIRCYGAHAYLSCCIMCGAATESIVLAAAIKKNGKETVLQQYNRAQGRTQIENMIIGQANEYIKREYKGYSTLLKYWRDASAHGKKSGITENEAYTSLALLLRFTSFMSDNWENLI